MNEEQNEGLTDMPVDLQDVLPDTEPSVDYIAMDDKLRPVTHLLAMCRYQLALDRLHQLVAKDTFLPTEMWRVWQRAADCYYGLLDMKKAAECYWTAIEHTEGMPYKKQCEFFSNYLFILHYVPDMTSAMMRDRHLLYDALFRHVELYAHDPRNPARRHEKIRIGYIAPTFCENILSFFCVQLLTRYDRSRFGVYLYELNGGKDDLAKDLERAVTKFRDFTGRELSKDVAQRIYDDEIDILFDLAVHTEGGHTLQVMRYRPAPIQMAGIGHMSTSGLGVMDYFLTDIYVDPPGEHDADFSEELVRLPHSHFCYTPPERATWSEKVWQLRPDEGVLFASFNNFAKISDHMLLLWKRILERVPDAKLLLKNGSRCSWFVRRVKDRARALGLPMDRVIFEAPERLYFDRYKDVDILLDTYPYVGGGTTCDALFAGVPVISRYGDRHGTRFGLSLLANVGLAELAAATDDEYVEKAVALAQDRELLTALHESITARMKASPVMDGAGYVRDVETAFEVMWQDYLAHGVRTRGEKRRIFV